MNTRKQLTDLGEWLGADAVKYIRAAQLFEHWERMANEGNADAASMLNALRDIHLAVAKV